MHAAVSQGWAGLTASWCLQHVLDGFAQSHTRAYTVRCEFQPQFAPRYLAGASSVTLHPFICPSLCTATVPLREEPQPGGIISSTSPTMSEQPGPELCTPWPGPGSLAPPSMCEESSQSLAVFCRQLLPAPARGLSDQRCLCSASSVCPTQGLGCHQP